jgi:hypothetical protein
MTFMPGIGADAEQAKIAQGLRERPNMVAGAWDVVPGENGQRNMIYFHGVPLAGVIAPLDGMFRRFARKV